MMYSRTGKHSSFRGSIRTLDLFSGIGGHALAMRNVSRPVGYCDIDPFARSVLSARIESGDIPRAPIFKDIRNITGSDLLVPPGMITSSFPCQDLSSAGTQTGLVGSRSSLFWETMRLVDENSKSVRVVILENSPRIRNMGLSDVEEAFRLRGFTCVCGTFAANDVGARHGRKRWYFIAVREVHEDGSEDKETISIIRKLRRAMSVPSEHDFVHLETDVPKLSRRIPHDTEWKRRCSSLGNAVLPQVVSLAIRVLTKSILNQRKLIPLHERIYNLPPPMIDLHDKWSPSIELRSTVTYPVLHFPLEYPKSQTLWSTPLHNPSVFEPYREYKKNFRNTGHIGTRLFHERGTMETYGYIDVVEARKIYNVNPEWIEALMGFPRGWTGIP